MAVYNTNEFRQGLKIEIDGQPYTMTYNQFVKPGKGNAFNRTKLKHLITGRVMDRTFKSGDTVTAADVFETDMRMLYKETDAAVFMNEKNYEQVSIPFEAIGDNTQWLMEDQLCSIVFYKGEAVNVEPPTFVEMKITETAPGVRGDTASGRVLKPATLETGAQVQVPIFIEQDEVIKVDTRTGEYVSRASS